MAKLLSVTVVKDPKDKRKKTVFVGGKRLNRGNVPPKEMAAAIRAKLRKSYTYWRTKVKRSEAESIRQANRSVKRILNIK